MRSPVVSDGTRVADGRDSKLWSMLQTVGSAGHIHNARPRGSEAMTVVGVTGHSDLTEPTLALVRTALDEELGHHTGTDLTGLTCLARGADQVFADAVLAVGGALHVVVPAADYFDRITDPDARQRCDEYVRRAAATEQMSFESATREAYDAASRHLVDLCETLIAVWDGSQDSGTGHAVLHARRAGKQTIVVWPEGAERRSSR